MERKHIRWTTEKALCGEVAICTAAADEFHTGNLSISEYYLFLVSYDIKPPNGDAMQPSILLISPDESINYAFKKSKGPGLESKGIWKCTTGQEGNLPKLCGWV